jgi:hypothetical protein
MFLSLKDELCLRNKGTEYIKSPEMLVLTIAVRKEHDKYDRRKKVGTTRASYMVSGMFLHINYLQDSFYSIMKTRLVSLIDVFLLMRNC